jgi:hypothetical protein
VIRCAVQILKKREKAVPLTEGNAEKYNIGR